MASSSRNIVPYHVLHNLSSVDVIHDEIRKRRSVKTVGVFQAERLVARKCDKEGSRYLVKWKGYSSFENTWEPEEHISQASLRYFESPKPPLEIVEVYVDRMRREIMDTLGHKGPEQRASFEFRHDVFKFLFHGLGKAADQKHWTLYEAKDFSRCKFPDNWRYRINHHGDGTMIRFLVKMRTFLGRSPKNYIKEGEQFVEISCSYVEKISIVFIKVPSYVN